MATLAESFLADLEDLSDEEPEEEAEGEEGGEGGGGAADKMEDDIDDLEKLNYDDLDSCAPLRKSDRYKECLGKVGIEMAKQEATGNKEFIRGLGALEEDPVYRLIVDCNALAVDIDNEIVVIHNFIRDRYRIKLPELESLVMHPIDYARVVKAIGNEMDLTNVDLDGLLPSATIMVVTVTASTTTGKPLAEDELEKVKEGCDAALELDEAKKLILAFVESRMEAIAPNLSVAVGSEVAARLMGIAGGLLALSKMPACNVQVLGAKKKHLAGMSTAQVQPHQGLIFACDLIQTTPPALRTKAARLVGAKCTLLARVDAYGSDPLGNTGNKFKEEMVKKIEKWQEPPPAKIAKPLPVPDMEGKKKRGGRRLRKMKERYGLTDMRMLANRMKFGEQEEEIGNMEGGLGMLGSGGAGGKLRVQAKASTLGKKMANKFKEKKYGSSGATSGLSSSLAFTPIQGIELENPNARAAMEDRGRSGTDSYFSDFGGFSKVRKGT